MEIEQVSAQPEVSPSSPEWRSVKAGFDHVFGVYEHCQQRQKVHASALIPKTRKDKASSSGSEDESTAGPVKSIKKPRKPGKRKPGRNYETNQRLLAFWKGVESSLKHEFKDYFPEGFDYEVQAALKAERMKKIAAARKETADKKQSVAVGESA